LVTKRGAIALTSVNEYAAGTSEYA
jgi:hypothetical protein